MALIGFPVYAGTTQISPVSNGNQTVVMNDNFDSLQVGLNGLQGQYTALAPVGGYFTNGVLGTANGGTGSDGTGASASTYLRGDSTWATIPAPALASATVFEWHGSTLSLLLADTAAPMAMYYSTTSSSYQEIISTKFKKLSGISTVTVYAYIKAFNTYGEVYASIGGQTGSVVQIVASPAWVSFTVDVSSLTNGTVYDCDISIRYNPQGGGGTVYLWDIIGFGS